MAKASFPWMSWLSLVFRNEERMGVTLKEGGWVEVLW